MLGGFGVVAILASVVLGLAAPYFDKPNKNHKLRVVILDFRLSPKQAFLWSANPEQ